MPERLDTAMNMAAAVNVTSRLPAATALTSAIAAKSQEWKNIVKNGRTSNARL